MTVLLNDFKGQWQELETDVLDAVSRVGKSGWYILGSEVSRFEVDFARQAGVEHCVGCANGLDAIELALRALGLEAGDLVLTTPLSAFATTLAIIRAGGVPLFADVDESGNIDLAQVEKCLSHRMNVRYFVPVHLYGNPLDGKRLAWLKSRFELRIVEDCAQAVGTSGPERPGTVGDLAATSFYPTKNLGALGDGGAVFGSNDALISACRVLRDYGQSAKYEHARLGMNSRLDELQAAILRTAILPRLPDWLSRRKAVAQRYLAELTNPLVRPLPFTRPNDAGWHLFPVVVPAQRRSQFMTHLSEAGVQSAIHYPRLISEQPAIAEGRFEQFGTLTNAEAIARAEVSLPIHPQLTFEDIERVVHAVNSWNPA